MTKHLERIICHLSRGGMIVITDDEDRENEGDLVLAARHATPEAINFMIKKAGGLICVPLEEERARKLGLFPMCGENTDPHKTAFTVSVDAQTTRTGISAHDRSKTIRALADPDSQPRTFRSPGHLFPLVAKKGGLSVRRGHTEASLALVKQAMPEGVPAVAVICEILARDGTMLRGRALARFCRFYRIPQISVQEIAAGETPAGRATGETVRRMAETTLPTKHGTFRLYAYEETPSGKEHIAMIFGDPANTAAPFCRVHSECLTGDVLGSRRCDCGEQLAQAMQRIADAGSGIIIYLRQEGRGIGLVEKIRAYSLQDEGADTVDANLMLGFHADERNYRAAAAILRDIGIPSVTLMTNNPDKIEGLSGEGIHVTRREPVLVKPGPYNRHYLETKRNRMNHRLEIPGISADSQTLIKEGLYEQV